MVVTMTDKSDYDKLIEVPMRYYPSCYLPIALLEDQYFNFSCISATSFCVAAALNTVIFEAHKPCRFAPRRAIARAGVWLNLEVDQFGKWHP
jgi:hypothetical protein